MVAARQQPSARRLFLAKSGESSDVDVTADFNADSFGEIIKHAPEFRLSAARRDTRVVTVSRNSRSILSRV